MERKQYTVVEHLGGTVFGISSPTGEMARGIFASREQAQQFADKLNDMALAPVHFMDVVEDYLYECFYNARGAACADARKDTQKRWV